MPFTVVTTGAAWERRATGLLKRSTLPTPVLSIVVGTLRGTACASTPEGVNGGSPSSQKVLPGPCEPNPRGLVPSFSAPQVPFGSLYQSLSVAKRTSNRPENQISGLLIAVNVNEVVVAPT